MAKRPRLRREWAAVIGAASSSSSGVPAARCRTCSRNSSRPTGTLSDGGQGTCLGLAIAKGIMEAHGGSIAAESPHAGGQGTRIVLTFSRSDTPRTKVLVIDDEAAILRFLKPALEANDDEMTSAGSGGH